MGRNAFLTIMTCLFSSACMMSAAVALAADQGAPAYAGSSAPPKVKHAKSHEKITLGIGGAEDKRSAEMLTSALNAKGVKGTVRESKGKPFELTASVDATADLSALANAVAAVSTPQKSTAPPTLSVVVFAPLTAESAQHVIEQLANVHGIDANSSQADLEAGKLLVRISGDAKVTPTDIATAVQSAGVTAQLTKSGKGKQT
jgi:hypothetical protein